MYKDCASSCDVEGRFLKYLEKQGPQVQTRTNGCTPKLAIFQGLDQDSATKDREFYFGT